MAANESHFPARAAPRQRGDESRVPREPPLCKHCSLLRSVPDNRHREPTSLAVTADRGSKGGVHLPAAPAPESYTDTWGPEERRF